MTEAFIRNFSAPYSLLQRHLVGEEDRKGGVEEHQHSALRPLITELTTSSFLPCIMDLQKVRKKLNFLQLSKAPPKSADVEYRLDNA